MKQDQLFIDISKRVAKESKCVSYQVGAVIVKEGRIISIGYNGSPAGFRNCNEIFDSQARWAMKDIWREEHHEWSNKNEIHAEMNAILFAAKNGIAIEGATLYCTHQPCHQCLKNMVQSGIRRIVYEKPYDKAGYDSSFLHQMKSINNIEIEQYVSQEIPQWTKYSDSSTDWCSNNSIF